MSADPREVLARYGLRAKKSWGQSFLVSRGVLGRIVASAELGADDVVVEIGAGVGTLSAGLAARAGRVLAIERDPDLIPILRGELAGTPAVRVIAADALRFDFSAAAREADRRLVVMGNLPYQIATPLLFQIVASASAVARAVVMVQRELAERMAARPGGKSYGRLSVMLQQAAAVHVLFHVPPGAFHPRPAVTSSVVRLEPRGEPLAPVRDAGLFDAVVRAAFGTRRKMLRRALEPAFGAAVLAESFPLAGVDGRARAETLTVGELARLTDAIGACGGAPGAVH